MTVQLKEITLAHSPDADDAFMFYALAREKINTAGLKFKQTATDIEILNQDALSGKYDVTAISFAAYPHICHRYLLTTFGASMGESYGPVLIAKKPISQAQLRSARIAAPGKFTTAFLGLQLYQSQFQPVHMPFDQIIKAVADGSVDAGLLIHEGQLTYTDFGLIKILDLGQWWGEKTGLPLPLGGNVIKKDLGEELIKRTAKILKQSILYALAHKQEALDYALGFGKGISMELLVKYIDMYVSDLTLDCGETGKKAIERLFEEAYNCGILKQPAFPEFVESV